MAILNRNFSTITTVLNSVLSSQMYGFVARSDTPWPNGIVPETITSADFNNEIIFTKRLGIQTLAFMVTRRDWSSASYVKNDIVYTEARNVYQRVTPGTSTIVPNHRTGIVDGWKYLETIPNDKNYLVTEDLIPLSMMSEKIFYLTPHLVRQIWVSFSLTGSESGNLPLDRQFRVIGIYMNPFDNASLNDTYSKQTEVKDYGYPFLYIPIEPLFRTEEQINRFVFQINIDE